MKGSLKTTPHDETGKYRGKKIKRKQTTDMRKKKDEQQLTAAGQIIRKLFGGRLDSENTEIVQGWLASGDSEEDAGEALGETFEEMVCFERKPRAELVEALPRLRMKAGYTAPGMRATTPLRQRLVFKVAAAVIPLFVVCMTGLVVWLTQDRAEGLTAYQTVSVTAPDSSRGIVLPDGTTVTLSAGSKLEYAENFNENRIVELNGEGYFRVVKAGGKTFTVKGGTLTVMVRGTEFLVRAIDTEDTEHVTLTTGKVDVTAGEHRQALEPGDVFTYNKRDNTVELGEAGRGEVLRLKGEPMNFHGEPLGEIFRTAADYYGVRIEVRPGVDTGREIVVGFSGAESPEEVMAVLRKITQNGFNYTMEGNIVTVTR